MSPGVTTRKPRVNVLLPGLRTALTVCHAMSIAITAVLPAPSGEFESHALQVRARFAVCGYEVIQEFFTPNQVGCNLGEPDNGFCSFDLAEERTDVAERVMSPVPQQACCLRRNLPLADRELPPRIHQLAHLVDP